MINRQRIILRVFDFSAHGQTTTASVFFGPIRTSFLGYEANTVQPAWRFATTAGKNSAHHCGPDLQNLFFYSVPGHFFNFTAFFVHIASQLFDMFNFKGFGNLFFFAQSVK